MVIGVRLPWQTPILPRWQRCEVRVAALLRRCSYQPGERLWSGQEVVSDRGAEFHGGVRVTNFAGCWALACFGWMGHFPICRGLLRLPCYRHLFFFLDALRSQSLRPGVVHDNAALVRPVHHAGLRPKHPATCQISGTPLAMPK